MKFYFKDRQIVDFRLEYLSAMYHQTYHEWIFKVWQQVVTKV